MPDAPKFDLKEVIRVKYGNSGITLAAHPGATDAALRERIAAGRYEVHESQAVDKMLLPGDVVVELGAGLGLVSTVAARLGRAAAVHCYEADTRMIDLIHETHRLNGVKGVRVTNAAITGDAAALRAGTMTLHVAGNFWANTVTGGKRNYHRQSLTVPTLSLAQIVAEVRPTVIICDIEGSEVGLFDGVDLSGVRHVLVELHPKATGAEGVRRVFNTLHAAGLVYDTELSAKAVPGFTRLGAAPAG